MNEALRLDCVSVISTFDIDLNRKFLLVLQSKQTVFLHPELMQELCHISYRFCILYNNARRQSAASDKKSLRTWIF